jgi:ligand-binding sensor domain-containing protein
MLILSILVMMSFASISFGAGKWTNYTNGNEINALTSDGKYIWAGTNGGIVRWDSETGTYKKYTTTEGLTDNRVFSIAADKNGGIWAGADFGNILKFDGTYWKKCLHGQDIVKKIASIAVDYSGALWFCSNESSEVVKYDGVEWKAYYRDKYWENSIVDTAADNEGAIWFCAAGSMGSCILRFDGVSWKKFATAPWDGPGDRLTSITVDNDGIVWCGSTYGVSRFNGVVWKNYRTTDGLASNSVSVITADNKGVIWVGTNLGVSKFDGNNWKTYSKADGLTNYDINDIVVDNQDGIWCGTGSGLFKFDGSSWKKYTTSDGLANNDVSSVILDNQGAKWFGTHSGLSKFDGSSWKTYTKSDGLPDDRIHDLTVDNNGILWFITEIDQVSRFDGTSCKTYPWMGCLLVSISVNNQGTVWVGGEDIAFFLDGSTWKSHRFPLDCYVNSIITDNQGVVWFGATNGITKYDGVSWFTNADGYKGGGAGALTIDKQGSIWAGISDSKVTKFDRVSWKTYPLSDGVNEIHNNVISSAVDNEGALWFGTYSAGVFKFDGISWKNYTPNDGLASNMVFSIAIDNQDAVWFGTLGGVSKFEEQKPTHVTDSQSPNHPESFGIRSAYPNPFNPSTTIDYTISRAGDVRLSIYSISGQLVETLVDEMTSAGNHRVIWNAANSASGVYLVVLESGGMRDMKKVMFVK